MPALPGEPAAPPSSPAALPALPTARSAPGLADLFVTREEARHELLHHWRLSTGEGAAAPPPAPTPPRTPASKPPPSPLRQPSAPARPRRSEIDALAVDAAAALTAHQRRVRRLVERVGAVSDAVEFWEAAAHSPSGHRRLLLLGRGPGALAHAAYHTLKRLAEDDDANANAQTATAASLPRSMSGSAAAMAAAAENLSSFVSGGRALLELTEEDETSRCEREVHRRATTLRALRDALAWQLGEEAAAAAAAVPAPERSPEEHVERLMASLARARQAARGVVEAAVENARLSVHGEAAQFTPAHRIPAAVAVARARRVLAPEPRAADRDAAMASWNGRACEALRRGMRRAWHVVRHLPAAAATSRLANPLEAGAVHAMAAPGPEEMVDSLCKIWSAEADAAFASVAVMYSPEPTVDGSAAAGSQPPPLAVSLRDAHAVFALSEEAADVAFALVAPPTRLQQNWIPVSIGALALASFALTLYARADELRQFYHFGVSAAKGLFAEHIREPLNSIYGEVLRSAGASGMRTDMASANMSSDESKQALERMLLSWAETNPVKPKARPPPPASGGRADGSGGSAHSGDGARSLEGTASRKWLGDSLESVTDSVAAAVGSATESVMAAAEVATSGVVAKSPLSGGDAHSTTAAAAACGLAAGSDAAAAVADAMPPQHEPSASSTTLHSNEAHRAFGASVAAQPVPLSPPAMDEIMDAMMERYEYELRNPITSLVAGELPRMLLIQVQALKAEMEAALVSMDDVMSSNRVTMAMSAMAPFGIGMIMLAYGVRRTLRALRITTDSAARAKEARGRVRARLRAAEVALGALRERKPPLAPADAARLGVLTLAVHRLYGEVARAAALGLVESQEEWAALREDIAMLADPNADVEVRLDCARRIGRLYACARTG